MSKRKTLWLGGLCIGLVGLAVLVVFVLSVGTRQPSATPAPQESVSVPVGTDIGEQAPDFTLTDIDGNKFSLGELRGRPVIVYFSASWCLPCAPETQELAKRKAQYRNLEVVWISVDLKSDSSETLRAHRRRYGRDDFIYALDTEGIARLYRVVSLGDLYLLDAQGRIVFKGTRPVGTKPFEKALTAAAGSLR
jgi:peroxiredoxin